MDLLMWQASVTANKPDGAKEAIKIYKQLISDYLAEPAARWDARRKVIVLLYETGQYDKVVRHVDEYFRLYPFCKRRDDGSGSESAIEYYLRKASEAIAAKNKAKSQDN